VLSSKVPTYLADNIHLASESSACSLRSSSGKKCSVTRVHSRFGDRCFAAAGPRIWNNLPASLHRIRRQLKTFMFQTDCCAFWLFLLLRLIITLTYLLTYLRLWLVSATDEVADCRTAIVGRQQSVVNVSVLIKLTARRHSCLHRIKSYRRARTYAECSCQRGNSLTVTRLDYCNSLSADCTASNPLTSCSRNWAVQRELCCSTTHHQWLPARQRVMFNPVEAL